MEEIGASGSDQTTPGECAKRWKEGSTSIITPVLGDDSFLCPVSCVGSPQPSRSCQEEADRGFISLLKV
ncbi:unnamed protein product [Sphagnum jensenii]